MLDKVVYFQYGKKYTAENAVYGLNMDKRL